jgi:hypothetical protein
MAPSSSLAALLHSPAASSNDSTIIANGKTLPDITLGSLGSSFRSDDQDGHPNGDIRRGRGGVSRGGSAVEAYILERYRSATPNLEQS